MSRVSAGMLGLVLGIVVAFVATETRSDSTTLAPELPVDTMTTTTLEDVITGIVEDNVAGPIKVPDLPRRDGSGVRMLE